MSDIVRSKTPLRIGFAGGGTDLDSYATKFGGVVLNATINLYTHCTIEKTKNNKIEFYASDLKIREVFDVNEIIPLSNKLLIHGGVYKKIIKLFNNNEPISLKITTYSDAPPGSGLGSSSSIVVSIIKAFIELLNLPLGVYDVAKLAYEIERTDLGLLGGKQDQYSATFGGFNFIEFYENDRVIVNPLRIKNWVKNELEESIILFFTGKSRDSSKIIEEQIKNTKDEGLNVLNGMHDIKKSAFKMKDAILKGDFKEIIKQINLGWEAKKKTSNSISNKLIENIYKTAMDNGAKAAKISGAGGGGFFMFFVDPTKKEEVIESLKNFKGSVKNFEFVNDGTKGWYL